MALRDYILAILSAPIADLEVTNILKDRSVQEKVQLFERWLVKIGQLNPTLKSEIHSAESGDEQPWLLLTTSQPYPARIGFRFVEQRELLDRSRSLVGSVIEESRAHKCELVVIVLCADQTDIEVQKAVDECWREARIVDSKPLLMEPAWVAAIVIEQMRPLMTGWKFRGAEVSPPPHFEKSGAPGSMLVDVRRVKNRYQSMLGAVFDEPGTYSQRMRKRKSEGLFEGEILLCTTFLPPVTHSVAAVERFYRMFGASENTSELIRDKANWERKEWRRHVEKYKRIDIIDRGLVEEYFAAPEYYQMPLSRQELTEQLHNVLNLLKYENYTMCLTPEAVGLSYELRGPEVQIRTDRRNKGQPRLGRISTLIFDDSNMRELFEREFWSMYRVTEAAFKNKDHIAQWLTKLAGSFQETLKSKSAEAEEFDVFLCHNSADKADVKRIGERLKQRGIRVWFDEWNLIPGRPWQRALEAQIANIRSAAVFVGENAFGPWMHMEIDALLRSFVKRGCPIIPVILPSATRAPELPAFLEAMHWVDFRSSEPEPLQQLIWGITGKRD